jgi:uncharacterized protein (TIGR00725 family)
MGRAPVIAIIGSGTGGEPAILNARELGRLIAGNAWVLISGGRDSGVMKAANQGAKEAGNGITIGILPEQHSAVSPNVDVAIVTDTGQARNNIIVLSADVTIACGVDGAGTASEVSLAIKNGKHVILLGVNEEAKKFFATIGREKVLVAETPSEAIEIAKTLLPKR